MHICHAVEGPTETADQVHHRVEQANGLPDVGQHVDGIEGAAQEYQRRDDHHRHNLQLLETVSPDADDETEQAEGDGGQYQEREHPEWMQNRVIDEQPCGGQDDKPENDSLGGRRPDIAEHDLEIGDRRRQYLIDGSGELGHVDAKGRVGNALHQQRQHHQARDNVSAIINAANISHARANGRAEHHEIQAGGDHWRQHTLHDGAFHARHLELVDCFYTVKIHYALHSYRRLFVHQANKYFFQ